MISRLWEVYGTLHGFITRCRITVFDVLQQRGLEEFCILEDESDVVHQVVFGNVFHIYSANRHTTC